jgi:ubiquinone biosynthesis protein UbiJ
LAGRALETALNHALSLDPDTQSKLAALNGRSRAIAFARSRPGAGNHR